MDSPLFASYCHHVEYLTRLLDLPPAILGRCSHALGEGFDTHTSLHSAQCPRDGVRIEGLHGDTEQSATIGCAHQWIPHGRAVITHIHTLSRTTNSNAELEAQCGLPAFDRLFTISRPPSSQGVSSALHELVQYLREYHLRRSAILLPARFTRFQLNENIISLFGQDRQTLTRSSIAQGRCHAPQLGRIASSRKYNVRTQLQLRHSNSIDRKRVRNACSLAIASSSESEFHNFKH
jgi:hypothetical protein